jgi:hypothetical protein
LIKVRVERWAYIYINGEKTKYMVSTKARVINSENKNLIKTHPDDDGYYKVLITHNGNRHTCRLYRLVALAFIPNDDPNVKTDVNHKDGDKSNNKKSNLEWCTHLENVRHAWKTGLAKPRKGIKHPMCKTTEKQVHQICELLEKNIKNNVISETLNVSKDIVRDIKRRKTWTYISENYNW